MKIAIEGYLSAWGRAFLAVRKRLKGVALPADADVEHIGSTAIPWQTAKPGIDIMISLSRETESGDQYAAAKSGFIKEALSRGRIAGAEATNRVVYQVSTVPLAPGAWLGRALILRLPLFG